MTAGSDCVPGMRGSHWGDVCLGQCQRNPVRNTPESSQWFHRSTPTFGRETRSGDGRPHRSAHGACPDWSLLSRLVVAPPQLLLSSRALEPWPAILPFLPNSGTAQILWSGLTLPAIPCLLPRALVMPSLSTKQCPFPTYDIPWLPILLVLTLPAIPI